MNADNTMKTTVKPPKHDWSRFDAMTEAQRNAVATHDPDALPLTPADFKRMKRTPQVKLIRGRLMHCNKNRGYVRGEICDLDDTTRG